MTEKLYTLEEAERELHRRECASHGHNYEHVMIDFDLVGVICDRCWKSWSVTRDENGSES
jgi:hypothetical protein